MPAWSWVVPDMPYVHRRVRKMELMDRQDLPPAERVLALEGLERISAWPGQRGPVLRSLARLLGAPDGRRHRIVEVGAGGGSLSRWVETRLRARGHLVEVQATDLKAAPGVRRLDAVRGEFADADAYFSNLLLHHLPDTGVRSMLARQSRASRIGWVHFDLQRHWLHFHGAAMLLRLARLPAVNQEDARRSIQQGFTRAELVRLTRDAFPGTRLRWVPPFRWELTWTRP
ncbi:MAG: hypothetical protein ACREKE_01990 [bacterium]